MTNTKINFCGVEFKNPIVTASGTFGFGMEYNEFVSIEEYGGSRCKRSYKRYRERETNLRELQNAERYIKQCRTSNPVLSISPST